ncbi:hypothetical protein SLA2020_191620 [Shorea laevis]
MKDAFIELSKGLLLTLLTVTFITISCCVNNLGASSCKLESTSFDLVIIHEAALSLQIASWMALLKETTFGFFQSSRVLRLRGKSYKEPSLNARQNFYGDAIMSMLPVKYSMHELILNWSSREIYEGHASVAAHILSSLENVKTMTRCLL